MSPRLDFGLRVFTKKNEERIKTEEYSASKPIFRPKTIQKPPKTEIFEASEGQKFPRCIRCRLIFRWACSKYLPCSKIQNIPQCKKAGCLLILVWFYVLRWCRGQAPKKFVFGFAVSNFKGFCIKGFFSSFFLCPQNLKVTEYRIVEIDRIVRTPKSDRIPKSNFDGIMDPWCHYGSLMTPWIQRFLASRPRTENHQRMPNQ